MSVYIFTGNLGAGKTLCAVGRIQEYLREGRRVATNLDLSLEYLLPSNNKTASVVRVPDHPTAEDLQSLGRGSDVLDESRYGLIVLDELGTWMNARQWGDKARAALLSWLRHSRKYRWDLILLVQDLESIDKQARRALCEFHVECRRADRFRLPVVSDLVKVLTFGFCEGNLPKFHIAEAYYVGAGNIGRVQPTTYKTWRYRAHDLYPAYDTEQAITEDYPHGVYSYLTPWHVKGRYLPKPLPIWQRVLYGLFPVFKPQERIRSLRPSSRLAPLMTLPPEVRWAAARRLVAIGKL